MVVEKFIEEIENMSLLELRISSNELGLKKSPNLRKARAKLDHLNLSSEMSAQELEKLIKIEKGIFPFKGHMPEFLHEPI